jgi:hypothetical protein
MVALVVRATAVNCCTGFKLGRDGKNNLLRAGRGDGVKSMTSASTSTTSWPLARASFACFFVDVMTTFLVFVGDFAGALAAVVFTEAFLATAAFLATGFFLGNTTFSVGFFFPAGFVAGFFGAAGLARSFFPLGFLSRADFFWPVGHFFWQNVFSWRKTASGGGGARIADNQIDA